MASSPQGVTSADLLDINRHVQTLLARWKAIAFGTALIVVLVGVGTKVFSTAKPEYRASVDVAVVEEEPTIVLGLEGTRDYDDSRVGFLGLVHQGSVARAVHERLGDAMPGVSPASLLARVDSELVDYLGTWGDLIRITTAADTPQLATRLGDLWAEEFARHVNSVYEPVPPAALAAVGAEIETARSTLRIAQSQLEAFMADDRSAGLTRQMEANAALAAKLWETHRLLSSNRAALASEVEENLATQRRLSSTLQQAKALRGIVVRSNDAALASNGLAIQLAKLRTFALHGADLPETTLALDNIATHASASEQRDDLDAFILALDELIDGYDDANARVAQALATSGDGALAEPADAAHGDATLPRQAALLRRIADLDSSSGALAARIEAADSTLARLERDRDAAAAALDDLQRKHAEFKLENASAFGKVRVASTAIVTSSSRYDPVRSAIVAGLLGFPLLVLLALVVGFRSTRDPAPTPASNRSAAASS